MIEIPTIGRASILIVGNSLEIKIPAKKKWHLVLFTVLWMVGFTTGGKWMIDDMQSPSSPVIFQKFMVFAIAGWSFGLLSAISIILWLIGGLEVIKINNGVLTLEKKIFSIGLTKNYQIELIKHLMINSSSTNEQIGFGTPSNFLNLKGGVIKFDYGMSTIKFGGGIDEAEGRLLLTTFQQNSNFKETNFG